MYINADIIIEAAALLGALGVLGGAVWSIFRIYATDRRQAEINRAQQEELTIICYGLRGALQGLIEQGCDGPCKDALQMLDRHLNQKAHREE